MEMKMKNFRVIIVVVILAAAALGYYVYLSSKDPGSTKETSSSVSESYRLMHLDLEEKYPKTPKEVVKLYSRIVSSFYNEKLSEEEAKILSQQARKLMDEELLSHNPYDEYYQRLQADINSYKKEGKKITRFTLPTEDGSETRRKVEGKEYTEITCSYYIKEKKATKKSTQKYTLRKDESGKWKILFWEIAADTDDDGDK